jgi:DNA-binding NtrC family response regulator
LFLDEIGDISTMMQLRLLRFLQESTFYPVGRDTPLTVDVRVIAATNVDLKEKVRGGDFREDLYFRLRVIDVILPPLRERGDDVLLLANHFIEEITPKIGKSITGISEQAAQYLLNYSWPGNVRELKHVIERACVLCNGPSISTAELPIEITKSNAHPPQATANSVLPGSASTQPPVFQRYEEELSMPDKIIETLRKTGGNKAKAARLLKIDRTTLYRKIKEYDLDLSLLDL